MQILVENLDELESGNAFFFFFFFSCICMALLSKSKDFYFFDSHTRDRFGRVSNHGLFYQSFVKLSQLHI